MNWAELSPDLLCQIAELLHDIYSFNRLRAVCKKWRSAVSISDHPPLLPWLLDQYNLWDDTTCCFYSLQYQKSHTIKIPQRENKCLIGPSHGYMLIYGKDGPFIRSPSLLNPLTGVQIDLPFENGDLYLDIKPVCLGPTPLHNDGEAVFYIRGFTDEPPLINQICTYVVIWQPNNNRWAKMKVPQLKTVAYHNGLIFMVHTEMLVETLVVDVETEEIVSKIPPPDGFNKSIDYLIKAYGEVLGVAKRCCRFDVYRLEQITERNYHWVKMNNTGDLMLFLDKFNGIKNGISARASGNIGGERERGNCIYFMKSKGRVAASSMRYVLARYDIAEDRVEVLPGPTYCSSTSTWVAPSLY